LSKKNKPRKFPFPFNKNKTEMESSILLVMIGVLAVIAWKIVEAFCGKF
jgi:hypothetical protein